MQRLHFHVRTNCLNISLDIIQMLVSDHLDLGEALTEHCVLRNLTRKAKDPCDAEDVHIVVEL